MVLETEWVLEMGRPTTNHFLNGIFCPRPIGYLESQRISESVAHDRKVTNSSTQRVRRRLELVQYASILAIVKREIK
jgi:hypothetical protein